MNEQAWWVVAIVAVVTSGIIGFFIGRAGGASRGRVDELEAALASEKAALEAYRQKVDAHFDKSAGLFVSMAGSYKSLFDHLASGYEELAPGGARGVFKERIETMLAAPALAVAASEAAPVVGGAAQPNVPASMPPVAELGPQTAGVAARDAEDAAQLQAVEPVVTTGQPGATGPVVETGAGQEAGQPAGSVTEPAAAPADDASEVRAGAAAASPADPQQRP